MSPPAEPGRSRRLVITPVAIVLAILAIAAAFLTRTVFVAGRRPLAWVLAAVVAAAAIEPAVAFLSRRMKRGFALVLVLVPLLAVAGLVARGVYADLDTSVTQLKKALPEAAARVEADDRFGHLAEDIDLQSRAEKAAENLEKPSSNVADQALDRGSALLVCTILTIFMLIWGSRYSDAALRQIRDEDRRRSAAHLVGTAFRRAQYYVDASLVQGLVAGVAAWATFKLLGIPAPTPLALVIAVFSLVPVIGLVVGSMPAVLLIAGYNSPGQAALVLAGIVAVQVGQVFLLKAVTARSLYVGPAVIAIAALIGLQMYGLGGAVFGTAIAVFGVALIDERADEDADRSAPADADPTEVHAVPEAASG